MGNKFKSTLLIGIIMMTFMWYLASAYTGIVVAKLPFQPFNMMRGITHRNIPGSDYTDCSMIFIYILSNICLRPIVVKLLGFDPPRGIG